MKDLEHALIGEQRLEIGRVVAALRKLHEMGGAVAGGQLYDAQPVAMGPQPKRFTVDRDGIAECHGGRDIALVDGDFSRCHHFPVLGPAPGPALVMPGPRRAGAVLHVRKKWCPGEDSNLHERTLAST